MIVEKNISRLKRIRDYFWDNRKIIISSVLAFFVFSVVYVLFLPSEYVSSAKLLPSGSEAMTIGAFYGLMPGLAERLTENGISSFLFPDILKSRTVILAVAHEPFDSVLESQVEGTNLAEFYGWNNDDAILRGFLGNSEVKYSFDKGIVSISFKATNRYLAYFVTKTWLDKLKWFIENHLTTEAKRDYEYLKQRLEEAQKNLKAAEDSLAVFVRTHKNYDVDPVEKMKYDNLLVSVESKRVVYKAITQQLEKARIDMVKSLPTVKILEPPNIPQKKSGPKRSIIVFASLFIGLIVGIVIVELKQLVPILKK